MKNAADPFASFWDDLLSRQSEKIRLAFSQLNQAEQAAVLAHLKRMTTEEGWHPEQRLSAAAAIQAVEGSKPA
jgi:hypothetical protein